MVAKTRNKKNKMPRMSKGATKIVDERGFGPEPEVGADLLDESLYMQALSWYARFLEPDEIIEACVTAMKDMGYTTKQIASAKRSDKLVFTVGSIASMINRKCIIDDSHLNWFK